MFWKLFKKKTVSEHQVSFFHSEQEYLFTVREDQTILDAALMQDVPIPYSCQVGSCGECRCTIQKGEASFIKDLAYMFDEEELEKGYTLACQTYPREDLALSSVFEEPGCSAFVSTITSIAPHILDVRILVPNDFDLRIGQYLGVTNPNGISRYYSIVSKVVTGTEMELEIHVALKEGGVMSSWWASVMTEEKPLPIKVGEAKGNFSVRSNGDIIAIAGGSGLGVTAALISQHLSDFPSARSHLVGVVKSNDQAYFESVIAKLNNHFGDRVTLKSMNHKEFLSSQTLTELAIKESPDNSEKLSGLICGSKVLVSHCKALYEQIGIAKEKVSYDEFI
ncbi:MULTISPECIES: 2Fe-2S iron-sulfur cluster-binding protein [unclassified Pseudoalteromonas]|uniref:2Fe-2S iron-sulfur cluster-binding protein n=1 Tax=unclassified Pseudoalteromonas TaxID=194690 RepID=UPI00301478FE